MIDEMISVIIRCEEVVVYHKALSVPPSVVAEYQAAVDRDETDAWFRAFAERYIDPLTDASGSHDYEDVELQVASP